MGTVLLQDYNNTDIEGLHNTPQPLACMHREGYSTQFMCLSVTTVSVCLTLKV